MPGDDLATLEDFRFTRPELFSLWYAKSFKLQVLLERELGLDEYRCLAKWFAASQAPMGTASAMESYEAVLDRLGSLEVRDWARLLGGWVTVGEYAPGHDRAAVAAAGRPASAGAITSTACR